MRKYNFFNLPIMYGKEDYEECISSIVKRFSGIQGLSSIYEWGSVSNPGISDIDIVLVFNGAKPLPLLKRNFNFASKRTRYLVGHPFVFISEDSFKKIRYIYPEAVLRLRHGRKIRIENISKRKEKLINIALLNDLIIRHYPRDFLPQINAKRINVRNTLLRLNSLRYTISSLKAVTGKKYPALDSTAKKIASLRENWFAEKDFKSLIRLNEISASAAMDIIGEFSSFLDKVKIAEISSGDKIVYNGVKNRAIFKKSWEKGAALDEMSKQAGEKRHFCSLLPLNLAPQLEEYSRHKGPISDYIRNNFSGKMIYTLKNKEIIKKRVSILNDQALLATKLKHSDFPAFFDFGFRPSKGINNIMLNIHDRIKFYKNSL